MCFKHASVWFKAVFHLLWKAFPRLVYESQEEQGNIRWAPVSCVWGDRRPVAALHQAFPQFKIDASLQLHWNESTGLEEVFKRALSRVQVKTGTTDRLGQCECAVIRKKTKKHELTWCIGGGRSGPDHGGEAVRWLALDPLLLFFLYRRPPLSSQGNGWLAVGAGEAGK